MTPGSASTSAPERRRERRVPVHLPLVVRGTDRTGLNFEEHTSSENLGRGGAAFATRYPLELGIQLEIQIRAVSSPGNEENEFSTHGRIVHVEPGREHNETIVGVEFTGPRFNRVFVSETT